VIFCQEYVTVGLSRVTILKIQIIDENVNVTAKIDEIFKERMKYFIDLDEFDVEKIHEESFLLGK